MPDQNKPAQDPQNTPQPTTPPVPEPVSIFPQADLPPLPPEFQNVPAGGTPTNDQSTGSAAPSDMTTPLITQPPKKKFGGGRIIATILGLFLLIGGIGAGILLTQEPQLFQQKAAYLDIACKTCSSNNTCEKSSLVNCDPGLNECSSNSDCGGGTAVCGNNKCENGETKNSCPADCGTTIGCTSPDISCGGTCVNPRTDNNNCGTCGKICASGSTCQSAICVVSTPVTIPDGGSCTVTSTDPNGGCGPNSGCSDPEHDGTGICGPTGGQEACFHTICPKNWTCSGAGSSAFCVGPSSSPPSGQSASCQNVKAYNGSYVPLSSAELSALTAGDSVNFCVVGSATSGSFDKAKFTINGTTQAETTTHRPGTQDYCQTYTIPDGVTAFDVTAQIHHVILGWK